jgi:hypothetical protein
LERRYSRHSACVSSATARKDIACYGRLRARTASPASQRPIAVAAAATTQLRAPASAAAAAVAIPAKPSASKAKSAPSARRWDGMQGA